MRLTYFCRQGRTREFRRGAQFLGPPPLGNILLKFLDRIYSIYIFTNSFNLSTTLCLAWGREMQANVILKEPPPWVTPPLSLSGGHAQWGAAGRGPPSYAIACRPIIQPAKKEEMWSYFKKDDNDTPALNTCHSVFLNVKRII